MNESSVYNISKLTWSCSFFTTLYLKNLIAKTGCFSKLFLLLFNTSMVRLNGWVFVYEISGCGFETRCGLLPPLHPIVIDIFKQIDYNQYYNLQCGSPFCRPLVRTVFHGTEKIFLSRSNKMGYSYLHL